MQVLVRTSKSLRTLFLAYPEACIQGTLQQYSQPVSGLIHASWALHRHDHAESDSQKAAALLKQYAVADWSALSPCILENNTDPTEALEVLLYMCEDVDRLVEAYAQNSAATIEQVVNPWVEYSPITLSTTEFTRVASAFWMLRIFYQVQLLFTRHETVQHSVQEFISTLQPWQVEQCLSVELFLGSYGFKTTSPTCTLIGGNYGAGPVLFCKSWLLHAYREAISLNINQVTKLCLTTFANASFGARIKSAHAISTAPWLQIQQDLDVEVVREGFERTTSQLRNHGWMLYGLVRHIDPVDPQQYHRLFLDLGMFFWDMGRLVDWDFVDPDDFPDIVRLFRNRPKILAMQRYRYPCGCRR
jgi:hypothetical protein